MSFISQGDFRIGGFKQEATVSQAVVQKLAVMSGGNVAIQQYVQSGVSNKYRLFCQRCCAIAVFDDISSITTLAEHRMESRILNTFAEFCKEHQHAPTVQAAEVSVFDTSRRYR